MNQIISKQMELDATQKEAVRACTSPDNRIVAVTGQAGTGKTTILKQVYEFWKRQNKEVVLAAPTGKAAKRIKELTGIPAMTFHRLLEYPMPGEIDEKTGKALISSDPKCDRNKPIPYDVILGDEYAMVNHEVHRNLLDAMRPGSLIRMFGDANQLSPIESAKSLQNRPSPFMNMLDKFNGVWLTKIHRQEEGSDIISNGDLIIRGGMPKRSNTFILDITDDPVVVICNRVLAELDDVDDFGNIKDEAVDFTSIHNQIISCTKKGWVGTESLNAQIQSLVQPSGRMYWELERHQWDERSHLRIFEGDKVVMMKNNYGLEVFNGETGIVSKIDDQMGIEIDFGDKVTTIPTIQEYEDRHGSKYFNPQKDIDLAYVITTHKCQGSEYEHVMYVMNKSRNFLLNRKNLYTGISRARKSVRLVTDQRALSLSLYKKDDKIVR